MVAQELDDEYLRGVEGHLRKLRFPEGLLVSARLGAGNKGTRYVLRTPRPRRLAERLRLARRPGRPFTVPARDESGFRALSDLRSRGINPVADAVARSADHILGFFATLRTELAFDVGCLNLHDRLGEIGAPSCFPVPVGARRGTGET